MRCSRRPLLADDAPPATVLAALLHDVGHMIHELGKTRRRAASTMGTKSWAPNGWPGDLASRSANRSCLHVTAKRYLCTVESDYFGKLAPDSVRSLKLQGGLMSPDEVEAFRANPHHAEAVRLRRYDEEAKDPHARTPDFDHYLRHVPACRRT